MDTSASLPKLFASLGLLLITVHRTEACTIDLASGSSPEQQEFCSEVLDQNLAPIHYHVTGVTSFTITGLPSGITAALENDTITISGIANEPGVWHYQITTDGGACSAVGRIQIGQSVDWQLECTTTGNSVTVTWNDLIAQDAISILYFLWQYPGIDPNVVSQVLPAPSSWTINDLPAGVDVYFFMGELYSAPFCASTYAEVTCPTTALGVIELEHPSPVLAPNPVSDHLYVSSADQRPIEGLWITSCDGREVMRIATTRSPSLRIATSTLVPGTYLLHVRTSGGEQVVRFLKH